MALAVLCLWGYLLKIITAQSQNISLLENSSATFTYIYTESADSKQAITYWNFRGQIGQIVFDNQNHICSRLGFINDSNLYGEVCNTTHVSLIIKTIHRTDNNQTLVVSFRGGGSPTITYILYVIVPIDGVEIINYSKTNVSIAENQWTTLECNVSPGLPDATINWIIKDSRLTSFNISKEVTSDGLTKVKSVLSLLPNKTMNGNNLTCSASNYLDIKHYDWVILNVTYPPDLPTSIEGFQHGAVISVIENKSVVLNCTVGKSNPQATLNWNCTDTYFSNVSDLNYNAKLLHVKFSRNKHPMCSCSSTYSANKPDTIQVTFNVLFPATISNITSNGFNIAKTQLDVIENDTVHVGCNAEGNPTPNFTWTIQNKYYSNLRNITLENVRRNNSTIRYVCLATNVLNDSNGGFYQGNDSNDFTFNVLYPPSVHALYNLSIIEGNSTYVNCTIDPGNPIEPTDITWINSSGKDNVLKLNKVNRASSRVYTCVANNTMRRSNGASFQYGTDKRNVYLEVLYPPENITIKSTTAPNHKVFDNIRLIENTSLELICNAEGNPLPSLFTWSGRNTSEGSRVYVHTSKTNRGGNITCLAKNVMTELPQNKTYEGTIEKTVFVDVLYPPEVNMTYRSVIEGEDVNITCVQTPGKVSHQSIYWTIHHTNTFNNSLIIRNVTRRHSGNYTFIINYTMIPTYGERKSDIITGVALLDVFYKAELTNFFVVQNNQTTRVTVNESDTVHMMCILDSNPSSTMQISVRNQTVSSGKLTKTLEYSISRSSCTDTGVYRCSGYNFLNTNGYLLWKEVEIFVSCSPRRSSSVHVQQNVTVSLNDLATLRFNALAYPLPRFNWWRITHSLLTEVNNSNAKIQNISDNEFQIEYVITNVASSDFGEYVLTINNTFGSHQESFFLLQKDTTSAEQNHPETEYAGPVAAGIIGSIIGIVAIVGAVVLIRSRLYGKQLNAPNISTTLNLSQVDQYELKDADGSVTQDIGIVNVYEQLKNPGSDQQYQQLTTIAFKDNKNAGCTETSDGGISNVYEKLHNTGSDQQYQKLKTFPLKDNEGQRSVYENLRIQRNTD